DRVAGAPGARLPLHLVVPARRQQHAGREHALVAIAATEARDDLAVDPHRELLAGAQRARVVELAPLVPLQLAGGEVVAPGDRAEVVARLHRVRDALALARRDLGAYLHPLPHAQHVGVLAQARVPAQEVGPPHAVAPRDLPEVLARHHLVLVQRRVIAAQLGVGRAPLVGADLQGLPRSQQARVLRQLRVAAVDLLLAHRI